MHSPPECSLAMGMVAAEARLHVAGQQAAGIVLWVGTRSDEVVEKGPWRASEQNCTNVKTSNLGFRKAYKSRLEALQTSGTWMTVTSCATQRWFSPLSQCLTQQTLKLGQRDIRQNTEVIYYVSYVDNTDPEWKITEVRALAAVATATHGNTILGVAVGSRQSIADQLLAESDRGPADERQEHLDAVVAIAGAGQKFSVVSMGPRLKHSRDSPPRRHRSCTSCAPIFSFVHFAHHGVYELELIDGMLLLIDHPPLVLIVEFGHTIAQYPTF